MTDRPAPQAGNPATNDLPFTAPQHDFGATAFDQAHNIEYGRQHNGYSHVGTPPECPACIAAAGGPGTTGGGK